MEHNFDAEDLAIFNRSLQLLHSPKIDSQRKLFHLLQQSLRKHHPEKFGLKKTAPYQNIENNLTTGLFTERDPRLQTTYERIKSSFLSPTEKVRDPRLKILPYTQITESTVGEKFTPPSPVLKTLRKSVNSSARIQFPSLSMGAISVGKPTVNVKGKNLPKPSLLRSASRMSARHNVCPNPVNLKRIRAVLARGDPFPTYLVKGCSNNITPDLHKEKL